MQTHLQQQVPMHVLTLVNIPSYNLRAHAMRGCWTVLSPTINKIWCLLTVCEIGESHKFSKICVNINILIQARVRTHTYTHARTHTKLIDANKHACTLIQASTNTIAFSHVHAHTHRKLSTDTIFLGKRIVLFIMAFFVVFGIIIFLLLDCLPRSLIHIWEKSWIRGFSYGIWLEFQLS